MGIVNVTPDSFFDGGRHFAADSARIHAEKLLRDGADIVDVGAESTRPGSSEISDEEQLARLGTLVRDLSRSGARVSIDTTSPVVAARALEDGAVMLNSVSLEVGAEFGRLAAAHSAELVLMHSRGSMHSRVPKHSAAAKELPLAMKGFSSYPASGYSDLIGEVRQEWLAAADLAVKEGVPRARLFFDPGLGFHKNADQSLTLLRSLGTFREMGFPLAVGPSMKSFIAKLTRADRPTEDAPEERIGGTIASVLASVDQGATLVRVHDVVATRQAIAMHRAIQGPRTVGDEPG